MIIAITECWDNDECPPEKQWCMDGKCFGNKKYRDEIYIFFTHFIETSRLRKSIIFSILLIIGEGDPVEPFPKTMDRIELIECDPLYEFQCHRPSRVINISTLLCIGIILVTDWHHPYDFYFFF